jgi:hypothetical protein
MIIQSATPGHTGTLRGLTQLNGVIDPASDVEFQASSPTTVPARMVQWYTSQTPADIYVRIAGTGATTSDYAFDYEVTPVTDDRDAAGSCHREPSRCPPWGRRLTTPTSGHTTRTARPSRTAGTTTSSTAPRSNPR